MAFFHRMVKLRKANKGIPILEIKGLPTSDQAIIGDYILSFYKDIFGQPKQLFFAILHNLILKVIPHLGFWVSIG